MTTQPVCVIDKKQNVNCFETHEGNVARFIAPLKPDMESFSDILKAINKAEYPWNFDYYDYIWNNKTKQYDAKYVKQSLNPSSFHPYEYLKDISYAELKKNPKEFDQRIPNNLLIIDLPEKQVVNITANGAGYKYIPSMLRVYKQDDPEAKKSVEKCKVQQNKGEVPEEIKCTSLYEEKMVSPKGFQMSTVYIRDPKAQYNQISLPRVVKLATMLEKCNNTGNLLKDTTKCLSSLSKDHEKRDWIDEMESKKAINDQRLLTFWK